MFMLVEHQELKDGSTPTSILGYSTEDRDKALSSAHSIMASALVNDNVVRCLAEVLNEDGTIHYRDYFNRKPSPTISEVTEE